MLLLYVSNSMTIELFYLLYNYLNNRAILVLTYTYKCHLEMTNINCKNNLFLKYLSCSVLPHYNTVSVHTGAKLFYLISWTHEHNLFLFIDFIHKMHNGRLY